MQLKIPPERALVWGSTALVVLCTAIVVLAIRDASRVSRVLDDVKRVKRPLAEAAYEIEINALELAAAVNTWVRERDRQSTTLFETNERQFRAVVTRYVELSHEAGGGAGADRLVSLSASYDSTARELIGARRTPDPVALARFTALQRELDVVLDSLVQPAAIERWHGAADEARTISARTVLVTVILAPLVLVVGMTAVRVPLRAYSREREAREESQRLSQEKTEFAAITAHELRSPLTAMLGSIRLMISGRAGPMPETALPYLEVASRNSAHLLNLINELLDLDRIEAGMMPFRNDSVAPADVVRLSTEALAGMASELGVRMTASSESTRVVRGDRGRLQQVVVNLLSNALKHAPRGSTVAVRAVDAGANVRFTVTDEGPGIAPEDAQRIFQRFVQTGSASQHASTGLGLTIAREIVLRHGGRIGVDSVRGDGSTFWVELRAHPA